MRLTLVVLCAAAFCVACSQSPDDTADAGGPRKCVGGVINDAGVCEAKCDPSKCLANNTCVNNHCELKCTAHSQCNQYVQQCLPAKEDDTGADIFTCQNTPVKIYGDPCPNGDECSSDETCIWSGPGDGKAYCTSDCLEDSDCPGGYECGYLRDPHEVCDSDPKKGNNGLCGNTDDTCLPAGTPGYTEDTYCFQKRVCMKKDVCATCTSDVDCSWSPGTKCTLVAGENRCAAPCASSADCARDFACSPEGFCIPRAGACTDSKAGTFCSPCRYDTDCAKPYTCVGLHAEEKACIDMTFGTECGTDADCPVSPGGLHGQCAQIQQGVYRCYAPFVKSLGNYSCF